MRFGELFWKVVSFGVVTVALVICGVLVLGGNHASSDYLNGFLGWSLIVFGAATAIVGLLSIAGTIANVRAQRRESALHVTPRSGPPTTPPPWGMGDVGRPGVIHVDRMIGAEGPGQGGVKIMNLTVRHLDVPIVVGFLLAWTLVACILLAPH